MRESISDIKSRLEKLSIDELRETLEIYQDDTRKGTMNLVKRFNKKIEVYDKEIDRLYKMRAYEQKYDNQSYICGIDEAGRGPLCGPVVAAAVILPKDVDIMYLDDSKKLSEKRREALFDEINEKALAVGVGMATAQTIDEINILNATYEAMKDAINALSVKPEVLLIDAVTLKDVDITQEPIIKGDSKSVSIAAASVIAKVTRDRMLCEYDKLFPEYNFAKNKGYGTKEHTEAIKTYGPCPIHRQSFVKNFI